MTYQDKLKDVRWQKKRLEIMSRDNFACRACFAHEGTMHVHHLKYLKRFDPWEYEDNEMITLCSECHAEWHRLFDNNIKPGQTFLVAKLHFDLDVKAMQDYDKKEKTKLPDIAKIKNKLIKDIHSEITISIIDKSPTIEIKTVDEVKEYSCYHMFLNKEDSIAFIEIFNTIIKDC